MSQVLHRQYNRRGATLELEQNGGEQGEEQVGKDGLGGGEQHWPG